MLSQGGRHDKTNRPNQSRRGFLAATGGLALNFMIVPRHVLGGAGYIAPSERVNIGGIGAGGMGGGDIATVAASAPTSSPSAMSTRQRAAGSFNAFPKARRYKDFREMIDKEAKQIDAVTVGTPDHIHAVASMAAIRAGKHVYCQKPLTHTLRECRELTRAAHTAGVATQMGNQGHATEGARLTNEWIQAGIIGTVSEVHVWSDRAGRLWKQGIGRPTDTPPVPSTLDWNLWLGPIRERPYSPAYAPVSWRGWWDFGTGAMGDMGCHIIDHPVWALKLGPPSVVEARTTLDGSFFAGRQAQHRDLSHRRDDLLRIPGARRTPRRPDDLVRRRVDAACAGRTAAGRPLARQRGLYIGSKGKMFHGSHGGMPQLLPRGLHDEAAKVAKSIERSPGTLRRVGGRLQRRSAPGLKLRLLRPAYRNHAAGRALTQSTRTSARVGQRKPQDQECPGIESSRACRISERVDALAERHLDPCQLMRRQVDRHRIVVDRQVDDGLAQEIGLARP